MLWQAAANRALELYSPNSVGNYNSTKKRNVYEIIWELTLISLKFNFTDHRSGRLIGCGLRSHRI